MTVTQDISKRKLAERDRLVAAAEAELGTQVEHAGDAEILATR
jgi:hypothetical protein